MTHRLSISCCSHMNCLWLLVANWITNRLLVSHGRRLVTSRWMLIARRLLVAWWLLISHRRLLITCRRIAWRWLLITHGRRLLIAHWRLLVSHRRRLLVSLRWLLISHWCHALRRHSLRSHSWHHLRHGYWLLCSCLLHEPR